MEVKVEESCLTCDRGTILSTIPFPIGKVSISGAFHTVIEAIGLCLARDSICLIATTNIFFFILLRV